MTRYHAARLAAVAVACALAGLAFAPLFSGSRAEALTTGMAALQVVVTAMLADGARPAGVQPVAAHDPGAPRPGEGGPGLPPAQAGPFRRRSVPGWVRVVVSLVVIAGYVQLTTEPGAAVVDGPARLLTSALPLDPGGPELAAVTAVVGLVTLAAAELVLRARSALAPAAPAVLCFAAALPVTASAPAMPGWLPAALAGAVGALLVLPADGRRGRRAGRGRKGPGLAGSAATGGTRTVPRAVTAVCVVAAAACVGAVLGPVAPGASARDRYDARDAVEPATPPPAVNPLTVFPSLLASKAHTPLFTVQVPRGKPLFRTTTFTDFDGRNWIPDATYRRAGRTLPADPAAAAGHAAGSVRATVRLPGAARRILPWVPTPGRAEDISTVGLAVDETTGDLTVPRGTPAPAVYHVTAALPPGSAAAQHAVAAPLGTGSTGYTLPATIREAAARATAGGPTAYERLARLRDFLSHDFTTRDDAPSGNGLYQITRLLEQKSGTPEQFASAFAVMARGLGYDARLVLGFRPSYGSGGTVHPVRARDAYVWAEVRFRGLGWVPFDPSPEDHSRSDARSRPRADTGIRQPAPAHHRTAPHGTNHGDHASRSHGTGMSGNGSWWAVPVGIAAALLAVALLVALAVPPLKWHRRRRRRHAPAPGARVTGAWRDTVDRLVEHGLPTSPAMTAVELAESAPPHLHVQPGAPQLTMLARLVDAARYSQEGVTAEDATEAWRAADTLRAHWRPKSPAHRIRHAVDPRPLTRR
jgi:transglutaminase-like putative cysteine protease